MGPNRSTLTEANAKILSDYCLLHGKAVAAHSLAWQMNL